LSSTFNIFIVLSRLASILTSGFIPADLGDLRKAHRQRKRQTEALPAAALTRYDLLGAFSVEKKPTLANDMSDGLDRLGVLRHHRVPHKHLDLDVELWLTDTI